MAYLAIRQLRSREGLVLVSVTATDLSVVTLITRSQATFSSALCQLWMSVTQLHCGHCANERSSKPLDVSWAIPL
jgi:hypothetical protein